MMNIYILYKLIKQIKVLIAQEPGEEEEFQIQGAGCLFQILKKMFKLIDRYGLTSFLAPNTSVLTNLTNYV